MTLGAFFHRYALSLAVLFLVALIPSRDLSLRANYLFIAAITAVIPAQGRNRPFLPSLISACSPFGL
jgi:hypothetical protein